ncbi:WhiB family transcriptional regulator [Streptomyces sp. SM12]|uniref:WhiB family transcriptional regulator n=1 Tax=Streptomyces sp. SM12 TaxID=1071602 RepID=UPI000CD5B8D3|nr:WhiB family transcriptional regulator [Streptomyces sp. SM12]
MDWRDQAACLPEDPELFFPVGESGPARLQVEEAKSVCSRCPVKEQCLEWAMNWPVEGVWGGLTEEERRAMKRRAAREAAAARATA